jgi:hypothetical protein
MCGVVRCAVLQAAQIQLDRAAEASGSRTRSTRPTLTLALHTVSAKQHMCFVCTCCAVLQAAQIQLDRAAEDFRQLHQERQDLIRQWDEARDAMKSRDEAIQVRTGLSMRKGSSSILGH